MKELETRQIVFLDRDGTINIDHGYITDPKRIELFPGVARALGDLCRRGFLVVVVSNQSAIGRGYATWEQIDATNDRLQELLLGEDADARLAMILCSPDAPWEPSSTRKPLTGMAEEVRKNWTFSESECWMVGDKISDVEFGLNLGLPGDRCILINVNEDVSDRPNQRAEYQVVKSLVEAVGLILGDPTAPD